MVKPTSWRYPHEMVEGAARAEKLETELAKMKEQYNKLSLLFDSAQAEKLTTRQELEQERNEAAEREAKLKTEEERLRKRNRTLTQTNNEHTAAIMKLQTECNSWRNEYEQAKKMLEQSDATLKDALENSKVVADNFATLKAQHANLVEAATALVDSIDHGAPDASTKPLLERVKEAPSKFTAYLKKTCCFVADHVLAVIQSFYPEAELDDVPTGRAEDCEKDKFTEYLQHFEPIAAEVVEGLQL
ncbi:unnamed protein product [Urochloa humidicola]